tara:strand:+ start:68 stop:235 length:168 start_codon:yes stop_codon:yes gene_type:complete
MTQFEYMVNKQEEIYQLQKELAWYREYALYVAQNHYKVDAEACSYADGDFENWNE